MAIFAKRTMTVTEWAPVQKRLGDLLIQTGSHDIMMFSTDSDDLGKQTIYIGLLEGATLDMFPGFEEIERWQLPDYMATLIAREDGFKERFPDIAAKRRTKLGRVTKPRLTINDLESLIVKDVRRRRHCEDFSSFQIYRSDAVEGVNWIPGSTVNYGRSSPMHCDNALREIVPRLQKQFDVSD